jgi:acyl-CoA synthetase (AMP-forming)/AMP-acid ligase II
MPKGVMWRHEDLFFAGMAGGNPAGAPAETPADVIEVARTGGTMVMFPVAPLMHGAAQLSTFIGFWAGNKTVLLPKFEGGDVLRTISREKVNTINIVGDAMARPIAEARLGAGADLDVSSLFVISSAGAVLSPAVQHQLTELFPNIFIVNAFGSSETGFNGSAAPGTADKGLIFQGNERTTVLDDDLKPVEPGSGVAQKRRVPLGYYKDAEKTASTFVEIDGERWVLMGDMATIEADGTITVFGRGSVCINSGGEKVYPEEVEAALKAHPAIFDAVVAGVPDQRFGERVAALVQIRADVPSPTAEEVEQHARTLLAGYKVPRVVVFVDEVLRSPSGKADYPWAKKVATAATAGGG